jgi:hypothetical protein
MIAVDGRRGRHDGPLFLRLALTRTVKSLRNFAETLSTCG